MKLTKKIKLSLLTLLIVIFAGCSMKAEYRMEIRQDKSMDFSVIMAMDDQLIEGMLSIEGMGDSNSGLENPSADASKEYTEEEKWAFIDEAMSESAEEGEKTPEEVGFRKEKYEQDGFKGYRYIKSIKSIDDISGDTANFDLEQFEKLNDSVLFAKNGNKYKASFELTNENSESAEGMNADVMFDIRFVVALPSTPTSHNATSVSEDGKTLTWDLLEEKSKKVEFEFEFDEGSDMITWGISGGVFALGLISLILVIMRNNKIKKEKNISKDI